MTEKPPNNTKTHEEHKVLKQRTIRFKDEEEDRPLETYKRNSLDNSGFLPLLKSRRAEERETSTPGGLLSPESTLDGKGSPQGLNLQQMLDQQVQRVDAGGVFGGAKKGLLGKPKLGALSMMAQDLTGPSQIPS